MKPSVRKFIARIPGLRSLLLLLRRCWKNRANLHIIIIDLLKTRRETKFLRHYHSQKTGQTLLIFVLDDESIYILKFFGVMATALRLQGWNVKAVFRNRSALLGMLYFRAFGICEFAFLEDKTLTAQEREDCKEAVASMLQQDLDIQAVKAWYFEGSWIGSQIISTLSRLKFQGMPDFKDPSVRALLGSVLPATLEHTIRADKFMQSHPARLAITIEANYASFGPLVDMAIKHGTDVIQMIQPWKDDAWILRRLTPLTRREHPASVAGETLDKIVQNPWTEDKERTLQQLFADRYGGKWFLQARNQKGTRPYSREALCDAFGLDRGKKIAVVFSHVLWDANLFYGDDLFKDYGDWFVQTIKAACANPSLNWLIKIHPANVWKRSYENVTGEYAETALIRQEIGELPAHVKLISADSDVSTFSLFENTDYCVTVRGTSGMEMVCFGKPCITAGTGRYSGLGFTVDSTDCARYLSRLAQLHTLPAMSTEQVTRAKWHAYTAFILRPWTLKSAQAEFAYKNSGHHPLDHNLHLLAASVDDIERNGDLGSWANWAIGKDIDYICTPPTPSLT